MTDLGKSFNKLVNYFHTNYRGVVVERRDGGYLYNHHIYLSLEELDAAIDLSLLHLEHSVNRIKNGSDKS
jgi:hypothetical protein